MDEDQRRIFERLVLTMDFDGMNVFMFRLAFVWSVNKVDEAKVLAGMQTWIEEQSEEVRHFWLNEECPCQRARRN